MIMCEKTGIFREIHVPSKACLAGPLVCDIIRAGLSKSRGMINKVLFAFVFFLIFNIFPAYSLTIYPVDDFYSIAKSSVSFQKKDILPVTAFVGVAALLFWQDKNITENIQEMKNSSLDTTLKISKYFGDGWSILGAAGLSILAGETFLDRRYTFLGIYILEGFAISGLFVTGVKFMVGRARPYADKGPYFFKPFYFTSSPSHKSFYSGHTTEAFTLASVISHFFKNIYVSAFAYTIASVTAVERIYNDKHWSSDVLAGGVTGFLIGRQIVRLNKDYHHLDVDKENIKISFVLRGF